MNWTAQKQRRNFTNITGTTKPNLIFVRLKRLCHLQTERNNYLEMNNEGLIFTSSITVNRGGPRPAHKAGFPRLDRHFFPYTATCTCRSWAVMAQVSCLERAVIDTGKGKSLSVCPTDVNHSHAHHTTIRTGISRPNQPGFNPVKNSNRRSPAVAFKPSLIQLIC